jgi:hypothetical protein
MQITVGCRHAIVLTVLQDGLCTALGARSMFVELLEWVQVSPLRDYILSLNPSHSPLEALSLQNDCCLKSS